MRRKLVIKRWWRGRTKSRYTRVGVETSLSSASQNKVGNLRKSWSLLVVEKRQWNRSTLERTNTTHTLITTTRQPTHRLNQQPFLTCGDKNPSRTCFSAFWWPFLPESYESARSRRHTDMPKFSLKSTWHFRGFKGSSQSQRKSLRTTRQSTNRSKIFSLFPTLIRLTF